MGFEFFEVVRVEPRPGAASWVQALCGQVGAVLGQSRDEGQEPTAYAVSLDAGECTYMFDAGDLVAMGEKRTREDYYDDTSIRVSERGEILE